MRISTIAKTQFISNCEPHFAALQFRENEPGNTLLVEADIPSYNNVRLRLRLFKTLVVVCFYFNQRSENVLILVRIFVAADFSE